MPWGRLGLMARLLVVQHIPSPAVAELAEAALRGTADEEITGVEVVVRPALSAGAADVLHADGILLGTPANIGYMPGALKHFFDQIYYPCLDVTANRPFALWVHGNNDTGGAIRSVQTITGALRWRAVYEPVSVVGPPAQADLDACYELAATLAATLMSA